MLHLRWRLAVSAVVAVAVVVVSTGVAAADEPAGSPPTPGTISDAAPSELTSIKTGAGSSSPSHPSERPIGVRLDSLSDNPVGAITLDGAPIAHTSDRNGIFLAIIGSKDRRVLESGTAPNAGFGFDQLTSRVKDPNHPDGSIVVISSVRGLPLVDRDPFLRLARSIGVTVTNADLNRLLTGTAWSMVGVSGSPDGTGWIKTGARETPGPGLAVGDISGYVRWNPNTLRYDFIPDRELSFSTSTNGANPDAVTNTMQIGSSGRYTSDSLASGNAGFQIVAVDAYTLALRSNVTVNTTTSPASLATALSNAANDVFARTTPLVFVQSIGRPRPNPQWDKASPIIESLGGSPLAFMNLDTSTSGDYSFVGNLTAGKSSAESGSVFGTPGPLSGVLAPRHDMSVAPLAAGPIGIVNTSQADVVNQPSTAFAPINTAAENFIGAKLDICADSDDNCNLRVRYGTDYERSGGQWPAIAVASKTITYEAGHGFTQAEFDHTKSVLSAELVDVARVHGYYEYLQKVFGKAQETGRIDVQQLGNSIFDEVKTINGGTVTSVDGPKLITNIVTVAGILFPTLKPLIGNLTTAYANASFASSTISPTGPFVNPIKTRADKLSRDVQSALRGASDNFDIEGRIVVTDPAKLRAASQAILEKKWKTPDSSAEALVGIRDGIRQWFAKTLVPVAYPWLIRATPSVQNLNDISCYNLPYVFYNANPNLPLRPTQGFGSDGQPYKPLIFPSKAEPYNVVGQGSPFIRKRANTPSDALVDLFFGTRANQLAINKYEWYSPRYFGPLHNANQGALNCDLTPRVGAGPPTSPIPSGIFGSS